jgi:predicted nucleic acid-binding protein
LRKSVYLESSVISYFTSRPSRDVVIAGHQATTIEWWNDARSDYDVFISPLVIEEISAGDQSAAMARLQAVADMPILDIKPEAQKLVKCLLRSNAVPANSDRDALHIAIAATQGIDYLLTWNFKHINNASTRELIMTTVSSFNFICPILCSPEELNR